MSVDPRDLREATRARADAVDRVRERLDGPTPTSLPLGRVAAGAAAVIGAAILATLVVLAWQPRPLDAALDVQAVSVSGLTLRPDGRGHLGGTTTAPELAWESGAVAIEAAKAVRIVTREGVATGRGGLRVHRDALGTRVGVDRGSADVNCIVDDDTSALVGRDVLCRPVSADTMLGRVRALVDLPTDALLAEIDLGLARTEGSDAARAELGVLRITTLDLAGRPREALDAARTWLDLDLDLRRSDIQRLAASLALDLEGCSGALPHLTALASDDAEAAEALHICTHGATR